MNMNLGVLFSGGKDSVMAVWDSIQKGHKVKYLITMVPKNPHSYMFHYPNLEYTALQAEAMGLDQLFQSTEGKKEEELEDLQKAVETLHEDIDGIAAGGLASRYQLKRIKGVADRFGLETLNPYWNSKPEDYWDDILKAKFKVMITSVSCDGLTRKWLGKVMTKKALKELKKLAKKHRFNLAGEGGEFETFVINGPNFRKRIRVVGKSDWKGDSGTYDFQKAYLVKKKK